MPRLPDAEILDFAERFMRAIQTGDTQMVRASYAPDAKIWHNTDNIEQTVDDNVKVLEWFAANLPNRTYQLVRREALKDGFLQQLVIEAILPDGSPWKLHACVVVKMENGLITRLDEYLDSAQGKALRDLRR